MSNALGIVFDKDTLEIIAYYEYNGTSDICNSILRKTEKEVRVNWRKSGWLHCDDKEHKHKDVFIYSEYGGGFYWEGKICTRCRVITDGFDPHETRDGRPDLGVTAYDSMMKDIPFPKDNYKDGTLED